MRIFTNLLFLGLILSNPLILMAQKGDTLEIQRNGKRVVSFVRFKANNNRKVQDGATLLKTVLDAKPDDELRLSKETIDNLGACRTFDRHFCIY